MYKKFLQPQVDTMGEVIELMEKVRIQGFREAIEVLEEMDRADNMATRYIETLKALYDAAIISSKPMRKSDV